MKTAWRVGFIISIVWFVGLLIPSIWSLTIGATPVLAGVPDLRSVPVHAIIALWVLLHVNPYVAAAVVTLPAPVAFACLTRGRSAAPVWAVYAVLLSEFALLYLSAIADLASLGGIPTLPDQPEVTFTIGDCVVMGVFVLIISVPLLYAVVVTIIGRIRRRRGSHHPQTEPHNAGVDR